MCRKKKIAEHTLKYNDETTDLIMRDIHTPAGIKTDRQLTRLLNSRGVKNRSDMLDFNQIYFNCFGKNARCRHNNIEWHYADLRKRPIELKTLSIDNFELYCDKISSFTSIIKHVNQSELQKTIDVLSINDDPYIDNITVMSYINDLEGHYMPRNSYLEYIGFLEIMFNNRAEFVRRALTSYTLNKQYNKLIQPLREIFTYESFVELLEYNIAYLNKGMTTINFDALLDKLNILFGLLRRIYDVMKSKTNSASKTETIRTFLRETPLDFNKNEQNYINYYYTNCGHIFMDIYFIFRTNKYRKNNLLTVSYFGSNHSKYISEYFVNIVRTHRVDYKVEEKSKRIPFTKEINLNGIMGFVPRVVSISRRSSSPPRRRSSSPKATSVRKSASPKASPKSSPKLSPSRLENLEEKSESKNEFGKGSRKKRRKKSMRKRKSMRKKSKHL